MLDVADRVVNKAGVVTARTKLAIKWEPLTNKFFNRVRRSMREYRMLWEHRWEWEEDTRSRHGGRKAC